MHKQQIFYLEENVIATSSKGSLPFLSLWKRKEKEMINDMIISIS